MTQIAQVDNKTLMNISNTVMYAWQQNHGTQDGNAHAVKGMRCVLVFIEDAFTKAEMQLAGKDDAPNQTLNLYVQSLLEHICREQTDFVEEQVGSRVVSTSISADTAAGWAMCLFKLAA